MEYAAFVFAIFGLLAYLKIDALSKRVNTLERQLTSIAGTSFHERRMSLLTEVKSYIGKNVIIGMKEERMDMDIVQYGNTSHGSNTILDADEEWILVHIETPKGAKDKLIRMESVASLKEMSGHSSS